MKALLTLISVNDHALIFLRQCEFLVCSVIICQLLAAFLFRFRWLRFAQVFKSMSNGDGAVGFAGSFNASRPDGVGEVGPVVVAFLQLIPAGFEVLLPSGEAEKLAQRTSSDKDTVVEVGLPRELDDALDLVAQIIQFVEKFTEFAGAGTSATGAGEAIELGLDLADLGIEEVGEAGVQGLVGEAVVVEPESVAA